MVKEIERNKVRKTTKYRCSCGIHFNVKDVDKPEIMRCNKCKEVERKLKKLRNTEIAKVKEGISDYLQEVKKYCSDGFIYTERWD